MNVDSLHSLLENAANKHGHRIAVEFGQSQITYSELLIRSARCAAVLQEVGAGPGKRVAFCYRKSVDAIVTMFGIIRTGAAYVPIDPAWPAERMQAVVDDAGISIWTGSASAPAGVTGITSMLVDFENPKLQAGGDRNRIRSMSGPAPSPERGIANILYTSGSTGRPKGVEITTKSLMHFSKWAAGFFELTAEDRIANHAPYNFDLSTFDIFAAVRVGATMCPVPESLKMFPYQMAKFIADRRISTWYSVPSALIMMQLRGKLPEHDYSRLRHVIFAGEVMPKSALQNLACEIPQASLTNLYGPTETNVCTYHACTAADLADDGPVPIGRPIDDTLIWIVDVNGRPVAQGELGELWVAGPTLTTGYFGDADLSSSRCVPAPDGVGHCYRTGDRVRLRPDGVLMFEGRIDRMIKCRGHRIEPGEIEAALHRHPAVKQAAVIPLADPVFGSRLKACISPREGLPLAEHELIAFCKPLIPAYMMPDIWHFMDALPQTDRGKIDLQSLMRDP